MGLAFLIATDSFQLLCERKVLKEAEYAALLDAEGVVEAARAQARHMMLEAERQVKAWRQDGHAEGREQARAELAQQLLVESLATQRQLQGLRGEMARIVANAVRRFIDDADPAALLQSALRRIDALVQHEPIVTVRVAPDSEAALREALARVQGELGWCAGMAVRADAQLARGACVLQTPSGTVEIGAAAQVDALRRALSQAAGAGIAREAA